MALRTVRVAEAMEAVFAKAEEVVSSFFRTREDHPERGTIEIFGERYVLVRAASLSVEFFGLVRELYGKGREPEADDFARNILFDLAHAIGKQDALNFHEKMHLDDPLARVSAGPVHFSHSGWAFVDIPEAFQPETGAAFVSTFDHPYSFESDAWLRAGRTSTFPVCIMNAGYSSGWCEASFGMPLVSAEILCRACGDETCRFVMAPPATIEDHVSKVAPHSYQIPDFFSRKRVEEDLRRSFAKEMAEREKAERKLRQAHKLEAVGRLAGGIAHDFNNLMAIVIARASLLERKLEPGDPMRAELDDIIAAGERASQLTRQLLAFSRSQVLDREPLELDTVVTELAKLLTVLVGEDVELDLQIADDTGWVEADRGQLEQVITNLVVNARDAMPNGGRIMIATSRRAIAATPELPAGTYATLTVSDQGRGMTEDVLARVFEPFFTTKEDGKGTGLGLATVYGIVKQSGGHIEVASELGKGSRFTVLLPETAARTTPPPMPPPLPAPSRVAARGGRILLVEDNATVRSALADYLRDEGFEVLQASGGEEALATYADDGTAIDLLLSDVVMPRMGGRDLALALRQHRPRLRILFMSGYTAETELLDGLAHAELIGKPFRPQALASKIREMLRR
ncbi:MAG: ATP-binding protein [Kofleriaceae bacterium]|nr:ATP-binding protein [Kofleriaceae bacterium]